MRFLYGIMRAYFAKGFRSFHTGSVGSLGQRAAKLLTFKVGGLKKKSAIRHRPHSNQSGGHSITTWTRGWGEGGSQMSMLLHKPY